MPNPIKIQLSKDGGTTWLPIGDAIAGDDAFEMVGGSATVKARLDSAAWTTVTWDVTATSDGDTAPTLTTGADRSCSFTVSLDDPIAFILRARVNGGSTANTVASTVVKVKTGAGFELIASGEESQASSVYGWLGAFNAIARNGGGGGGSFSGITLDDPVASFSSTAKFVGYDGVYFTTSGTEIGWHLNGTLVADPWASTSDGITAADTASAGASFMLAAQRSTGAAGGSLSLLAGEGTSNGFVFWGLKEAGGAEHKWGVLDADGVKLYDTTGTSIVASFRTNAGYGDLQVSNHAAADDARMLFALESPASEAAVDSYYSFGFSTLATTREPLRVGYESTTVSGRLIQRQATSPTLTIDSECAPPVTTSGTPTATLLTSRGINTNEAITVTVDTIHDDGTNAGRTVYTRVFRRGAGSATEKGTEARDISPDDADTEGHTVTVALNADTIEVKVLAASSTSTKHRAHVTWRVASIG